MSTKHENPSPKHPGSDPADGDDSLDERLDKLKTKLDQSGVPQKPASKGSTGYGNSADRAGIGQAFRLSSEFIAGVVVGAGIGYLVDTFFGTSPWGLIVFLMLGFAAAVLNVMRAAGMVAESQMRLKPAQELNNQQQDEDSDRHTKK